MSVLIKGINVKEIKRGAVAIVNIDDVGYFVHGDDIIVIPDHGDLVERDEVLRIMCKSECGASEPCEISCIEFDLMKNVPIVIPAERSEE